MGGRRGLVLPDGTQGEAGLRLDHEVDNGSRQKGEEETRPVVGGHGRVNPGREMKPVGALGKVAPFDEEDLDDLAHAEGAEGKVVASKPRQKREFR